MERAEAFQSGAEKVDRNVIEVYKVMKVMSKVNATPLRDWEVGRRLKIGATFPYLASGEPGGAMRAESNRRFKRV